MVVPYRTRCRHIRDAEFLDLSGGDPSLPCIERMREIIAPDDGGPIFVYYATYERGRLNELGERHPAHAELAQKYVTRLVDLLPIVKQHFYHPSMRGSFSIKKAWPVVAPDLNYAELQGVQEGTGAQVAYIDAALNAEIPPNRKAAIDQQLRTYCRQDTWAMVEIAHFLAGRKAAAARRHVSLNCRGVGSLPMPVPVTMLSDPRIRVSVFNIRVEEAAL